jgi:hypothetical protein
MKKTSTIIVTFYESFEKEINKILKEENISGIRVGSIINRWAIEVPFWKEQYFLEKFSENELVKSFHPYVEYSKR